MTTPIGSAAAANGRSPSSPSSTAGRSTPGRPAVTSPTTMPWYTVDNVADVPSPALLVYPERVAQNIRAALEIVGERGGCGRT